MSKGAVLWATLSKALQHAGKKGMTSAELAKSTSQPLHSISGVLSSKFRSGDLNVEDILSHAGVYILPQFGGQKFDGRSLGGGPKRLRPGTGEKAARKRARSNGIDSPVGLTVNLGGRVHMVSLAEARALQRALNGFFGAADEAN